MRRRPPVWIAKLPYKEGSAVNRERPSSTGCMWGLGQEQHIREISGCVTLMCKLLGKGWQDDWVTPGRLAAAPNGLLFNRSPCLALLCQKSPKTSPSRSERVCCGDARPAASQAMRSPGTELQPEQGKGWQLLELAGFSWRTASLHVSPFAPEPSARCQHSASSRQADPGNGWSHPDRDPARIQPRRCRSAEPTPG